MISTYKHQTTIARKQFHPEDTGSSFLVVSEWHVGDFYPPWMQIRCAMFASSWDLTLVPFRAPTETSWKTTGWGHHRSSRFSGTRLFGSSTPRSPEWYGNLLQKALLHNVHEIGHFQSSSCPVSLPITIFKDVLHSDKIERPLRHVRFAVSSFTSLIVGAGLFLCLV